MRRSSSNPWLHRFIILTAVVTLALIGVGGLVTSHGAGMAVPDWPTTYGYNMFFFPLSQWIGGIFYEHSHRLVASLVGLLTTVFAVWLALREDRKWIRWTGLAAFLLVVVQGLLGGLRVTLFKDEIGIFHATLAQVFFVLVCSLALFTSPWWNRVGEDYDNASGLPSSVTPWLLAGTVAVFVQLILGATMRHQHAGLAVPDFPLSYGQWWPPMDAGSVEQMNRSRMDARDFNPITPFQIGLHMAHRIGAALTLTLVSLAAWKARQALGGKHVISRLSNGWAIVILGQAALGVATVLTNKAADIATAHVIAGAFSLSLGSVVTLMSARISAVAKSPAKDRIPNHAGLKFESSTTLPNPA